MKSFSDSVNRKFESLGPWTKDHQLMLNSFLQERFLMANVVRSANTEIEKSKTTGLKSIESLRKTEAEVEAYRGLFGKLKNSLAGVGGVEIDSIIGSIFVEFDRIATGRSESLVKDLGNLTVTDARISSLIREKDAELIRLREELTRLNKLKSSVNNEAAHQRSMSILNEENNKLKNEINSLKADRGSSELINSYKQQIQALNERIHQLEQEKSDLAANVLNLENELKVKLSVQSFNERIDIKGSTATAFRSDIQKSDASKFGSPVDKYRSPKEDEGFIKMVDSKIEPSSTSYKSPTYQLTESQHSQSSASREQSSYGTTIQQGTSNYPGGSSVSGSSAYGASSEVSRTGIPGATTTSTYQVGGQRTYQTNAPTYEATKSGSGSGVYQTSNSGIYQSGTSSNVYQAGSTSNSGVYQTQQGGERSGSYQSSTYQPYQGNYSYQSSSSYRSGTSGSGVGQPQSGNAGGSSQYSSTYKYEKK